MTTPNDLMELAARVRETKVADNALDVQIEIALFRPGSVYTAVRANAAGTKLIYTDRAGNDVTCWAEDWTMRDHKEGTIAALRARARAAS